MNRGSGGDSARGTGGTGGASRSELNGASRSAFNGASAAVSTAGRRGGRPRRGRGASSGASAAAAGDGAASLGAGADGASRYGLSSPPASGDGAALVRLRRIGRLRSVIRKLRVVQWAPFRSGRERDPAAGMKTCDATGRNFDARVGLEMRRERGYYGSLWTGRVVRTFVRAFRYRGGCARNSRLQSQGEGRKIATDPRPTDSSGLHVLYHVV